MRRSDAVKGPKPCREVCRPSGEEGTDQTGSGRSNRLFTKLQSFNGKPGSMKDKRLKTFVIEPERIVLKSCGTLQQWMNYWTFPRCWLQLSLLFTEPCCTQKIIPLTTTLASFCVLSINSYSKMMANCTVWIGLCSERDQKSPLLHYFAILNGSN